MPIYEFDCTNCGRMFEEIVSSAGEKVKCAECGSAKVKRRFSVFGFVSRGKTMPSSTGSLCKSCKSHNCLTCH